MQFTQEEIVLEPATREQADTASPLIYDTDPHLFHYLFGGQEFATRYFAAQWRKERSLFSYRYCTVAVASSLERTHSLEDLIPSHIARSSAREVPPGGPL